MGKFYQSIQSYGPSFMTKFCSALYLENLLTNIFAKLNLRGGVSCMPAALLFEHVLLLQIINYYFLYTHSNCHLASPKVIKSMTNSPFALSSR